MVDAVNQGEAVKLQDGGPVLFRRRPLTENGEESEIVKLRTPDRRFILEEGFGG